MLPSPLEAAIVLFSFVHVDLDFLADFLWEGVGALKTFVPSSSRLTLEGDTKVGGEGGGEVAPPSLLSDMAMMMGGNDPRGRIPLGWLLDCVSIVEIQNITAVTGTVCTIGTSTQVTQQSSNCGTIQVL